MAESQSIRCLLDLTRRLLERPSLDLALQAVCDVALDLLPGDHSSVRILDESGTRLLCGARAGTGIESAPMTFALGEGVIGWAVAHRQAVRVADAAADQRFKRPEQQGFAIRSMVVVPLWCGGKVVGVVGVTSPRPGQFGEEEEAMALLLANCASPYIERARAERLSITDPGTMAFNEPYLLPRMREEFERARRHETRVSLMLMTLEEVDAVRARHGADAVQRALQGAADRVRASVRLSDILVRRGEDTFALLMPDMALSPASLVADRIRHSLTEYPLRVGAGQPLALAASIGVACWSGRESAEGLLDRAHAALGEARARDGGGVMRARHFSGRQLDASAERRCLRESCDGLLVAVRPAAGRTYYRCGVESCRSIWYFGD